KVFIAYCKVNRWILRRDIKRSVGKTINGIKITESGILAAAHLSGAGNVKKYLRSNGSINLSDAYGTSIESYMKIFAGYDVSFIVGDRKASI
ncbi:peptidoglycan-binding protein LysM, partial [Flavobacteriaceae bacterium]|nr:peptidoglycan-binding protein LysM [Flavobacteriaceae bacterium]